MDIAAVDAEGVTLFFQLLCKPNWCEFVASVFPLNLPKEG